MAAPSDRDFLFQFELKTIAVDANSLGHGGLDVGRLVDTAICKYQILNTHLEKHIAAHTGTAMAAHVFTHGRMGASEQMPTIQQSNRDSDRASFNSATSPSLDILTEGGGGFGFQVRFCFVNCVLIESPKHPGQYQTDG